jgi:hypothetical protein
MSDKVLKGVLYLMTAKEALESCKIEGIYPSHYTLEDYFREEHKLRIKEKLRQKRLKKKLKQNS